VQLFQTGVRFFEGDMIESLRRDRALSMKVSGPALVPTVRTFPFLDYDSLSDSDIEECDRHIDHFLSTKTILCPSSRLYFTLMIVLRERRRLLSQAGDLLGAAELDVLVKELSDFFLENKLYVGKAERVALIQEQYESQVSRLEALEVKWHRTLDDLLRQRARDEMRVESRSVSYINRYDDSLPAVLPPECTRLSAGLLDLRERERHLIGGRRFLEAAELHREFNRRQRAELVQRREEFVVKRERDREQLEKRNRQSRVCLDMEWTRKIERCQRQMEAELQPLRAAVGNLWRKLVTAKTEYIGEDDPILRGEPCLAGGRESGNLFRTENVGPMETGPRPRTMKATVRPLNRGLLMMTTKTMSQMLVRHGMRSAV
jgi:hypothetical protein